MVLGDEDLKMNQPESRSIVIFLSGRRIHPTGIPQPKEPVSKRRYGRVVQR